MSVPGVVVADAGQAYEAITTDNICESAKHLRQLCQQRLSFIALQVFHAF